MLLLIDVVLDPRSKMSFVNCLVDYIFESDETNPLKAKLLSYFKSLYKQYQCVGRGLQSNKSHMMMILMP